jgi:hypothetical protein
MPPIKKKKRPTLTKGSQGPLKPIKPKQALKPIKPFQQYETQQSSSASEEARKRSTGRYSPAPRAVKGIIANYRATSQRPSGGNPNPIKRISPARIGKLKQIRMNERSQAFAAAGNRNPTRTVSSGGKQWKQQPSRAGRMAQMMKSKPVTFRPTERAPSKAPGKYRPVSAAPIAPRDYRKDITSFTATEKRNKDVSDMRERSRLKKAFKQRRTR